MNLEFIDESPDHAALAGDDLVDAGNERGVPRWLIGLLVAAAAALVVVVVQRKPAQPNRPAKSAVAAPTVTASRAALPGQLTAGDPTLSAIYLRARDTTPAEDVVRSGSAATPCKAVRSGTAPQIEAGVAVQRDLPGYLIIDAARIIDQTAGLCALQLRAHDASGTVAVIMVASPPAGPSGHRRGVLETKVSGFDQTVVQYARFITSDGWTVVVGTSGPRGEQPRQDRLGKLATDVAVRW